MKSLFLLFLLTASAFVSAEAPMQTNQGLSMQLDTDLVFQKMVKVYGYDGSFIREFPLTEVANNQISMEDHMILQESDFAFDFHGDYYYFRELNNIQSIVN
ncbi:hypothetical protein SAMN05421640_0566 [Ekhidna lutea]|uniref:Uncharacterized protein n=1 Tax=Ekhidna lutea TaxID=447679 RepID=A0A239F9N0_EKHLU|nr:hypothetical protein [Ekhidna lutea]SNS53599.1 hypothetical protein SAMN05421640_0566 [Ekhidna lutea]